MNTREYIDSGILELYVFGRLSDEENDEVHQMAESSQEVRDEIISIEKAVINLSYSVAPYLSAENYEKIRQQLIEKHSGVVEMKPKRGMSPWLGWAAAVILMFGLGYQYYQYNEVTKEVQAVTKERGKFEQMVASLQVKNNESEKALSVIRDKFSKVVTLEGQAAAPEAYAKVYVNPNKKEIYVDIAGLPAAPEGKVYQVWALKLDPLTPTSIGVLDNASKTNGILQVENFDEADAFGITLEPAGGSASPTMEQLYTLGKV
ncbi:anti-sigma factor [Flavobacterium album]|uniref:Anti-sigma factor n=1 Tax=Flavobacterium album TaxID=2175091 RepID=A0A2S1QZM9_9FLAO|nr:anti-sigma factor [Flavobacterium album]AWH85882.1 anti-sigma factor [Flavobacterium album]